MALTWDDAVSKEDDEAVVVVSMHTPTPDEPPPLRLVSGPSSAPSQDPERTGRNLLPVKALDTEDGLVMALGGIQHDDWGWQGIDPDDLPKYVRDCPTILWRLDKSSGDVYSFVAPCDSWRCRSCSELRAQQDLDWALEHWTEVVCVWFAEFPYDESAFVRMRKRSNRRGAGMYRVTRETGDGRIIQVYSSEDLSGRKEPKHGTWMPSSMALTRLIDSSLRLPGVLDTRFLGTWHKQDARKDGEGRSTNLGRMPKDMMADVVDRAERKLEVAHGDGARDRLTPELVRNLWEPLLQYERSRQWEMFCAERDDDS